MTFPTFFFSCICFIASATWRQKEPGKTPTHCREHPWPSWAPQHPQSTLRHNWEAFLESQHVPSIQVPLYRCVLDRPGQPPQQAYRKQSRIHTAQPKHTHKEALLTQMRKCSVCHSPKGGIQQLLGGQSLHQLHKTISAQNCIIFIIIFKHLGQAWNQSFP